MREEGVIIMGMESDNKRIEVIGWGLLEGIGVGHPQTIPPFIFGIEIPPVVILISILELIPILVFIMIGVVLILIG
jgi:hypothetical protein